jgi:hypothetical protein
LVEYEIPVRNDSTGEVRVVAVSSVFEVDAQVEALQQLFRSDGWHKCTAMRPEERTVVS